MSLKLSGGSTPGKIYTKENNRRKEQAPGRQDNIIYEIAEDSRLPSPMVVGKYRIKQTKRKTKSEQLNAQTTARNNTRFCRRFHHFRLPQYSFDHNASSLVIERIFRHLHNIM